MPVVGAAGEEGGEPGLRGNDGINVDAGEVAVAARRYIKAKTKRPRKG
jgi:hypothetical protein